MLMIFLLNSCQEQHKTYYLSPPGYNINKPDKIKMKEVLDEISGIVYDKKENAIVAVNDEEGKLFKIDLSNTFDYKLSKFGGSGDYEDPNASRSFASILYNKGITYELDVWGEEWPHDWNTWRAVLPHYLETRF